MVQQGLPEGYKSKTEHLFEAIKELVDAKVSHAISQLTASKDDSMAGYDFGREDKAEENLLDILKMVVK